MDINKLTSTAKSQFRKFTADDEQVMFYPTYGYMNGESWTIPLRARVYEPSIRAGLAASVVTRLAALVGINDPREQENFEARFGQLLADNESGEDVGIRFESAPTQEVYPHSPTRWQTDKYGLAIIELRLPRETAEQLLSAQRSSDGWLTFRATAQEHTGTGRVRLIEPTGKSVISDIDDTIKVSEVPAGKKTLIRNTFFRDFVAVPERAELYAGLEGAAFHYVSGSPWQLAKPLVEFLFGQAKYPEGSLHMSDLVNEIREKLKEPALDDLHELVAGNGIFQQKVQQISEIMNRFPGRQFTLIGDSGECDPEVYRIIKGRFGDQVSEIRIRDVVNDPQEGDRPNARLAGMTLIKAATVKDEATHLDAISKAAKGKCGPQ